MIHWPVELELMQYMSLPLLKKNGISFVCVHCGVTGGPTGRILICFHSLRTHVFRCPVALIDRAAERMLCGELGQGVALLSCLLSPFFLFDYFHSLPRKPIHRSTVNSLSSSRSFSCSIFSALSPAALWSPSY